MGYIRDLVQLGVRGYLSKSASVSLLSLDVSGSVATARLYETLCITWIPAPKEVPAAAWQLRRQDPAKYTPTIPRGPRGDIVSDIGTRHEVTLVKGAGGWQLTKDAYGDLWGSSPDLAPGSWAAPWGGGPTGIEAPAQPHAVANPMTQYSYNYSAAQSYATAYCSSYNTPTYCNFNSPCGGDCTNFVSQCFRAGNEVSDGSWFTYNGVCGTGSCPTYSSPNAGSDTWANAGYLRDWIHNSGRGQIVGYYNIGIGAFIYYASPTGHAVIVVQPPAGGDALVCSHDPDLCNASYNWGVLGGYGKTYEQVYSTYNA